MNDEVRTRLGELIATYGPGLADDPRRVEALLRDVAPGGRQETFVLVSALRAQLIPEIRQWHPGLPASALTARLTARLQQELSLRAEEARWAVESWLLALGIPLPASPQPETPPPEATATRRHAPPAQPPAAWEPVPAPESATAPPTRPAPIGAVARTARPAGGVPPSMAAPDMGSLTGGLGMVASRRRGRIGKLIILAAGLAYVASVTLPPDYINNGTGPRTLRQATNGDLASPLYAHDFWIPVALAVLAGVFALISLGMLRRSLIILAMLASLGLAGYTFYIPTRGAAPGFGPYGPGYWLSVVAAVIALCAGVTASARTHGPMRSQPHVPPAI
jgi:hypothetical protein